MFLLPNDSIEKFSKILVPCRGRESFFSDDLRKERLTCSVMLAAYMF
ncbi:hypothetical protein HMPREF3187_01630 [Aerococcus christensenii]|uniref:Uncharacterized protein n=1 Tax=Aerococcus christensenii TaxID=87541 RepID=A0A133XS22_9LACT|nr:hypothetical protein HMPREF3187_01630 [Aerococcus christensenii]